MKETEFYHDTSISHSRGSRFGSRDSFRLDHDAGNPAHMSLMLMADSGSDGQRRRHLHSTEVPGVNSAEGSELPDNDPTETMGAPAAARSSERPAVVIPSFPVPDLPVRHRSDCYQGIRRPIAVFLAGIFILLAMVGVLLPGLPATPFLLLASYLLVRSSPQLHARLQSSWLFGRLLRDWEQNHAVSARTKWWALTVVVCCLIVSLTRLALPLWLRITITALAGIGIGVICRLPVVPDSRS